MNLSTLRENLTQKWVLYPLLGIGLLILLGTLSFLTGQKPKQEIKEVPLPVSEQPVSNGQFQESAPVSQTSKTSVEKLQPDLPYRQTITTSTGNKVTFVVLSNKRDPYTLYIETAGINYQLQPPDPDLPKNVLDFRETASTIFEWLNKQGVSQTDLFIVWGNAIVQKSAESWLKESPEFPKVIKSGDKYEFSK